MPNITVLVVPGRADPAFTLAGTFEIVRGTTRTVVCEESRRVNHYYDAADVVAEYEEVFTSHIDRPTPRTGHDRS